jgi:putative hydrolase of the HAD superfamily
MIQAIVYDAVGTLIHVQPAVQSIYAEIGRQFGSRLSEDEIRRRFFPAFARQDQVDEQAGWLTSEERELERWRAIVGEVLDDVADQAGCFHALFEAFGKPAAWSCDPDALDLLIKFQRRGIRQAMASNFDRRLRAVVAPMPIAPYVDPIVVSSEVGWRKPAAAFFAHVADSLRLPMEQILYVGDDPDNDYHAACTVGMRAVLLDPKGRHADVERRIKRLAEVCDVV